MLRKLLVLCLIHSQGIAMAAPVGRSVSAPKGVTFQVGAPTGLVPSGSLTGITNAAAPSLAGTLPTLSLPVLGETPTASVQQAQLSRITPVAPVTPIFDRKRPQPTVTQKRKEKKTALPEAKDKKKKRPVQGTLDVLASTIKKIAPVRALSLFFDHGERSGDGGLVALNAADEMRTPTGLTTKAHAELSRLRQLKQVLGDGTAIEGQQIGAFGFRKPDGKHRMSYGSGIEGFLFTKLEQERDFGQDHAVGQLDDYFSYLEALLVPMDWALEARRDLRTLRYLGIDPVEKNHRLNKMVRDLASDWRTEVKELDSALWGRDAAVYMILARAYNKLKAGKNFFDSIDDAELDRIAAETGANTVWILDMFEIGDIRRWGTGGGSPYAIKGYNVKKSLGGDAALKRLVDRAHAKGMRVVADYIPNHTSLDSTMINERPEGFIHLVPPQPNAGEAADAYRERIMAQVPNTPWGEPMYYLVKTPAYPEDGARVEKYILVHHPYQGGGFPILWVDMAQIDYSHPEARKFRINEAVDLFKKTGIDGIRRDMSYFVLNERFFRHWLGTLKWERDNASGWVRDGLVDLVSGLEARKKDIGGREYLDELLEAVKAVNPDAYHFDEAYEEFDALSRAGAHARYNKTGLFDALGERNSQWVRGALRELAFRKWQVGSAGLVNFPITHDADDTHGGRGYAVDRYGPVLEATLALTLGLRPNLIYNGIEQGVSQKELLISDHFGKSKDLNKPIPFDIPVKIDWSKQNSERKAFVRRLGAFTNKWSSLLTDGVMDVPTPYGNTSIVAYTAAKGVGPSIMVAANLAEHEAWGHFQMDGAATEVLGAFMPKAGKRYRFTDRNDGNKVYEFSGRRLIAEGMFLKLGAGQVHLFEVEEFDAPAGENAAAAAKTFGEPKNANAADALGVRLSLEAKEAAKPLPAKESFFRASWDTWTKRLTNSAFLAFLPLQVPQIIANFGFIAAGTLTPISILPWMGYSTGVLANMILLSYFVSKKEKGAALVQSVGILSSAVVVGQIFHAGFMPAYAFWSIAAAVVTGLGLNFLNYRGIVNGLVWSSWKKLIGMAGLAILPLVFTATFMPNVAYWPAVVAAGAGGLFLLLQKFKLLPVSFKGVWMKASAWTATLLFMFGPLAQISANLADPTNIQGLSLLTILLATLGNGLMIPRAVHTKDGIWLTGSAWAVAVGGIGVMATMFAFGFLNPLLFYSAAAFIAAWFAFSIIGSRRARK